MSFLLDALRKSEQAARRREAPTIHSASEAADKTDTSASGWFIAAFSAPAFLLMSWWGLGGYTVDFEPPPQGEDHRLAQAESTSAQRPQTPGNAESTPTSRASAPARTEPSQAPGQAAVEPENRDRTPVEHIAPPVREAVVTAPEARPPVTRPRPAGTAARDRTREPLVRGTLTGDAGEEATNERAAPAAPPRQNYVDYWELPDNVRGSLPEFNINVLVYAQHAADRFILMNGQRLREGDSPHPGLKLEIIRRNGAVFSYRRYRFIVAPDS